MITLDDFKKLEIRIGRVVSAERIPGAAKLIFDFGNPGSAVNHYLKKMGFVWKD